MQITLCEDDGIFHDGVPQIVIVVVQFDDGKKKRLPYPADKTLSALYQDLQAIAPQVAELPQDIIIANGQDDTKILEMSPKPIYQYKERVPGDLAAKLIDKSNIIEKEDFVTLIRIDEGRDKEHSFLLMVGQELRVLSVISTMVTLPGHDDITKVVQGYDVVDDKAARPERTRVFPHEVALSRKRTAPIIPKNSKIEEILPCPGCNSPNSLALEGTDFKGTCASCGLDITIARIIKKCLTDNCKKDAIAVSCFDVGGKFQGKCNTCGSVVEVPYVQ